ncbi:4-diphosphocytidyl-2C-methyl-D-erythritolkinase [Dethiosulfovibrio peptidovorans DSM 11002]|uniref:4-diphosphocytidyl-2-C-methyl-D-erythritol kinase n=1 Tax=Dethiosulfovibrio peptidovorans DSM 11002 TaxID=469381 RepID=D2Z4M5_9BACT|nr:4-diphosphocytidyl-2C-methyl-D-erythritol kinase [Dethiosulfovibrio peptidovorans]EFC92369.1 4-diphosphocytidyl-2C-methyl-D-erythritolkinase [Dethiosulfovibrio peptidovorans DSM 11002]
MEILVPSDGKINLSLRIVGRRENGYHDLVSVFMRMPSLESLSIVPLKKQDVDDVVEVRNIPIDGVNLVKRVIDLLRGGGVSVPSLLVSINKEIPPGTGLGCGSGNGVAVYKWIDSCRKNLPHPDALASVGADLPFFAQDVSLALVEGVGEDVSFLPPLELDCALLIPVWRSATLEAYGALDRYFSGVWPKGPEEARQEALSIVKGLSKGSKIGLLPNDFLKPLMVSHPEYRSIFDGIEKSGALAWGLSGSGSAVFALYRKGSLARGRLGHLYGLECVEKIILVE